MEMGFFQISPLSFLGIVIQPSMREGLILDLQTWDKTLNTFLVCIKMCSDYSDIPIGFIFYIGVKKLCNLCLIRFCFSTVIIVLMQVLAHILRAPSIEEYRPRRGISSSSRSNRRASGRSLYLLPPLTIRTSNVLHLKNNFSIF